MSMQNLAFDCFFSSNVVILFKKEGEKMSFSENLKAARKYVGISQKDLAKKLNVTPAMIAQYESGKRNPKKDTIDKIAKALNMGYSYTKEGEPYFLKFVDTVSNPEYEGNEKFNKAQYTLAAHFDGAEYTEEELEEIKRFAEFLKSKRNAT